jgi:hypothetical protein
MTTYQYSRSIEELKNEIIENIKVIVRRVGKDSPDIRYNGRSITFKEEMFGRFIAVHETQELLDANQETTSLGSLSVEELAFLLDDINKERFAEKKFSLKVVVPALIEVDLNDEEKERCHELLRSGGIKTVKDVKELVGLNLIYEHLTIENDLERVLSPENYNGKSTIELLSNPTQTTQKWKVIYSNKKS